jgi:hypothetical protein
MRTWKDARRPWAMLVFSRADSEVVTGIMESRCLRVWSNCSVVDVITVENKEYIYYASYE